VQRRVRRTARPPDLIQGCTVWWDPAILPGDAYGNLIDAELMAAKCVVVGDEAFSELYLLLIRRRSRRSCARERSADSGGGSFRDVGSGSASEFYGADEASCSGGD
jgi:hypothetical protein